MGQGDSSVSVALLEEPMFWGCAGAFIYAAPKFATCVFENRHGGTWWRCACEFVIAMAIGTISAGVFTLWTQEWLKMKGTHDMRVIAALIGLLANRVAPTIVDVVPDALGQRISRFLKGGPQ